MKLIDLKPKNGARRKPKNIGRGRGSGHGKTSCRGHNGQGQHDGKGRKPGFEGGQTPIYRRLPKFQVNERPNKRTYSIVNLKDLDSLSTYKEITPAVLLEKGIIDNLYDGVRILGDGNIKFSATIKANHFTESAKSKIEKAGGKWEVLGVVKKT